MALPDMTPGQGGQPPEANRPLSIAERIAGWKQRGIGMDAAIHVTDPATGESTPQNYLFSMQLPDYLTPGIKSRVLIHPTPFGYDFKVVRAKVSKETHPLTQKDENERFADDFERFFASPKDPDAPPAILPGTITNLNEPLGVTYEKNKQQWPFEDILLNALTNEAVIQAAEKEELRLQRASHVEALSADVTTLEGFLTEEDSALREVFSSSQKPKADIPRYDGPLESFDDQIAGLFGTEGVSGEDGEVDLVELEALAGAFEKRFQGPMGETIEELDREGGLVRIIAANVVSTSADSDDRLASNKSRVMGAAIRLPNGPGGEEVHVFVFPRYVAPDSEFEPFAIRTVTPKKINAYDDKRKQADIEDSRSEYALMLTPLDKPNDEPYLATGWTTTPFESPIASFDRNLSHLPFDYARPDDVGLKDKTFAEIVDLAIQNARVQKLLRKGITVSEEGIPASEIVNPAAPGSEDLDLDAVVQEWSQQFRQGEEG